MHKSNDFPIEFKICISPLGLKLRLPAEAYSQNDEWTKLYKVELSYKAGKCLVWHSRELLNSSFAESAAFQKLDFVL